jgi:tetratricopeptide (TPR) repeat protein
VVEYVVRTYGMESLKQILTDLGDGVDLSEAMARHTTQMDKLETDFVAYARAQALNLAPGLDWSKPEGDTGDEDAIDSALASITNFTTRLFGPTARTNQTLTPPSSDASPSTTLSAGAADSTNYWELTRQARAALSASRWREAKAPLEKLIALDPEQRGPDNAYILLAAAHRSLNESEQERAVLVKVTAMENDDTESYLRLMELDESVKDWPGVAENAERYLEVNPLVPAPYRFLARASEELGRPEPAIRSYQRLLLLDPPDPAEVHYRLGGLLLARGDAPGAKRQTLQALEEAPRFRDAQRLLLRLEKGPTPDTNNASPPAPGGSSTAP